MLVVALVCLWVAVFLGAVYGGAMTEEKERRQILFAVAGVWVVFLLGGGWLLLPEELPPAPPVEAKAPEEKSVPKPLQKGEVVLVIDEATLPKETENQPLAIERTENPMASREKRQEFRRLGRHLRNIEQVLMSRLHPLTAEAKRIDQRFKARQISNYDALYQKSQIKIRQAEMIEAAMEEKRSALEGSSLLTAEEIGSDVERIKERRDAARQKREEYQGVLRKLEANVEIFRDL